MTDRFAVLKTHDALEAIEDITAEWTELRKAIATHETVWGSDTTKEIVGLLQRARAEFNTPATPPIGKEYHCVTWVRDMDALLARLKEEHG